MADQTIELIKNKAIEKLETVYRGQIVFAENVWNEACEELAQEMQQEGLTVTAQTILAKKVSHHLQ